MIRIPESRFYHAVTFTVTSEPLLRRRIKRGFVVGTQKTNCVLFDVPASVLRTWLILNWHPEEWHIADDTTYLALQCTLIVTHEASRHDPFTPRRKIQSIAMYQRCTDKEAKDGPPMIAAPVLG